MSPIIYTPHRCETPAPPSTPRPDLIGTLWQCETCQAIYEAIDGSLGRWYKIADPYRKHCIEDASRRVLAEPAQTVTPAMVQLVLDTYTAHTALVPNDGAEPLGWCGECETAIYGAPTIQVHAREKAAAALQDALDKAGWDATE